MSNNYENNILDAIQTIVNHAVNNAGYDRTIKATVKKCEDSALGKYIVQYQDSLFNAYSNDENAFYTSGTYVYVLIPGNDMSQTKTILGTVDKLGSDYVSVVETEDGYELVGANVVTEQSDFSLSSYGGGQLKYLYDRDNEHIDTNLININTVASDLYLKKSDYIVIASKFKTLIPAEQREKGDYGIGFDIDFKNNSTGETVTKTYLLNVDNMTGNPYNYPNPTRQCGVFEIDGENFISIKSIYIYEHSFNNTDLTKSDDIFITDIELTAANILEINELTSSGVSLITKQGAYFDDSDSNTSMRSIEAQVRIKGRIAETGYEQIKYYWFVEDNSITIDSDNYCKYGGKGWKCLNKYNEIKTEGSDEIVRQWLPGENIYYTKKQDNRSAETRYKCIAIYSDNTILSKETSIYNLSTGVIKVTIESDSGTMFTYDVGNPTLTCYINGVQNTEDYTYAWSCIDNNGIYTTLEDTTAKNTEYHNAITQYNTLRAQILEQNAFTAAQKNQLDSYKLIIDSYDKDIQRVESNIVYNIDLTKITKFCTYKCSVFNTDGVNVGTAVITLYNGAVNTSDYTLIINNGNQIFKYDENGVSPASEALENPQPVLPLSFTLIDRYGNIIEKENILNRNIKWIVPSKNTLIKRTIASGETAYEDNDTLVFSNTTDFSFLIENKFDAKKMNNDIQLVVTYKDITVSATTNLLFTKEGESGTNGTNYICKIVPNSSTLESDLTYYPTVYLNANTGTWALSYTRDSEAWFKVQLYKDGERIFESTSTGNTTEMEPNSSTLKQANVKWSILKNKYTNNIEDASNLTINENTGVITVNNNEIEAPSNIIKCTIEYDGVNYTATYPVILVKSYDTIYNYKVDLQKNTGFRYVMYTTDGVNPAYDNTKPFTLEVLKTIDATIQDISTMGFIDSSSQKHEIYYDWSVLGKTYRSNWKSDLNLAIKKWANVGKNEKYYIPNENCDGMATNNAVFVTLYDDTAKTHKVATINIPIHMYLNKYGKSYLNDWDGNSIEFNKDEGRILAPQIGAGKKDMTTNTFTGMFMGQVQEADKAEAEFGLYGYNNGERTVAISAQDGSARFGKNGSGQIVIDPSKGEALISSGNYSEANKTGMQINLSEPSIKFGSGDFSVDKNGHLSVSSFTTVTNGSGGKSSTLGEMNSRIDKLDVLNISLDMLNINVPTDKDFIPAKTDSYIVHITPTLSGEAVVLSSITTEDEFEGIDVTSSTSENTITFSVNKENTIENEINVYHFTFQYQKDGKIYPAEQTVVINAINTTPENIQVGGRNYALGTATVSTISRSTEDVENGNNSVLFGAYYDLVGGSFNNLFDGKTITISAIASLRPPEDQEELTANGTFRFYAGENLNDIGSIDFDLCDFEPGQEYRVVSTLDYTALKNKDADKIGVRADNLWGTLQISNMKVELGSIATDWTPAYEDSEKNITTEYLQSDSSSTPLQSDTRWTQIYSVDEKYFLWQRTVTTINQITTYSTPILIYTPSSYLDTSYTQYYISSTSQINPVLMLDAEFATFAAFPTATEQLEGKVCRDASAQENKYYICAKDDEGKYKWISYKGDWALIVDGAYDTWTDLPLASEDYENKVYRAKDTNFTYLCKKNAEDVYEWTEYDGNWLFSRPVWIKNYQDKKYLWTRIKYVYANPAAWRYGSPYLDTSWEDISEREKSITTIDNDIKNSMRGTVYIKDGEINVYDATETETESAEKRALHKVVINTKGIGFSDKVNTGSDTWNWETQTIWGYNSKNETWEFNADGLNVINLRADDIESGILTLAGTDLTILDSYATVNALKSAHSTGSAKDCYYIESEKVPYTWDTKTKQWIARPGGEFKLVDNAGKDVCTIDINGLHCSCSDGSQVYIKTLEGTDGHCGLQLYQNDTDLIAYTDTSSGRWVTTSQKVTKDIQIGEKIKIIATDNGIRFIVVA